MPEQSVKQVVQRFLDDEETNVFLTALHEAGWHLVSDATVSYTHQMTRDATEIRATVRVDDEVIDSRRYITDQQLRELVSPEYRTEILEKSVKQSVLQAVGEVIGLVYRVVS